MRFQSAIARLLNGAWGWALPAEPAGAEEVLPQTISTRSPECTLSANRNCSGGVFGELNLNSGTPMNLRLDHLLEALRSKGPDILAAIDADPLLVRRQAGPLVL